MDKAKFEDKDIFWDFKERRDAADMGCDDILPASFVDKIPDKICMGSSGIIKKDKVVFVRKFEPAGSAVLQLQKQGKSL